MRLLFCVISAFFVLINNNALANSHDFSVERHLFEPWVIIAKNVDGEGIAITADKHDFHWLYTTNKDGNGQFTHTPIPFTVVSTKGVPISYRLTQSLSQHYCRKEDEKEVTPLAEVALTIDGEVFSAADDGAFEKSMAADETEQDHELVINLPSIPRLETNQLCYGRVGIIASLTGTL